jgi:hypothetical protein
VVGLALVGLACTAGESADDGATATTVATGSRPLDRYADYESINYDDPTHWVCRPDGDDICQTSLDTTVIGPDGTLTVEPFEPALDPAVDCFYVYPTISRDQTPVSDWEASPEEEGYAVLNQAARLRSVCRVFAPVYRQATLTALVGSLAGTNAAGSATSDPYDDVLDAFRTYMAEDNGGRGFVLVGHSQGAWFLGRLMAEEIDTSPDVRELFVSAFLAGSSVTVPDGADVGGQFQHIPLCRSDEQTGCVVTWSSFRSTDPPPATAYFGRPSVGEGVAGCTNPAALGGGAAPLQAYFPASRSASILASLGTATSDDQWVDPSAGAITTPFVALPGLVEGECVASEGFNYLAVTVVPDDGGPRVDDIGGDLTPEWGLHLVDVSLVMGDMVDLIRSQSGVHTG